VNLKDENGRYGIVSVALHWSVAALVMATLAIAIYADGLPRDAGRPLRFLHMSLGLTLAPLVVLRILWRMRSGKPTTQHRRALERGLAAVTWRLLLVAPMVLLATGPFLAWLHDRPIGYFGLFEIPPPVAPDHALRKNVLLPLHSFFGYLVAGLIALHLMGALKHLLVYRDGVAERMLRPFRRPHVDTARVRDPQR
jgi:cytochrome b561